MLFGFAAIIFSFGAVANCNLAPSQSECGALLGSLCRSGHSMRRLADGKILFVGGTYTSGTACDVVAFDPVKGIVEARGYLPHEGFQATLGMRVNDNLIGFTNRMPEVDPNNDQDQQGDFMAFYDTNEMKWVDTLLRMSRQSQASTPTVIRYPDKAELVLFQGMYTRANCEKNEYDYSCGYEVTIFSRIAEIISYLEKDKFIDVKAEDVYLLPVPERKKILVKDISPIVEEHKAEGLGAFPLRRARIQFDSTTFPDGRIFIVGGKELPSEKQGASRFELSTSTTAEFYVPSEKTWFETPPLPDPILTARSFTLSDQEVLVVDTANGRSFIWSFVSKLWREGFKINRSIDRGMMHSSGRFVAKVPGKEGAELFVWNPVSKASEFIKSPLGLKNGTALVELQNQTILEAQTGGLVIWDLKKKAATRLRK